MKRPAAGSRPRPPKRNSADTDATTILESLRGTKRRVRIFYGDPATGRDWGESNDVVGMIGRSTGRDPILLLIANARSTGGGGILTKNVLRVLAKRGDGIVELYRHPRYTPPNLTLNGTEVLRDGEVVARFKSAESAQRWAAFMLGLRLSK